jgi:hypothetical protein
MIVILNGSREEITENANLADLVAKVSTATMGIAVALDDEGSNGGAGWLIRSNSAASLGLRD